MNEISKVSDITWHDVASYLRIYETTAEDVNTLKNLLAVAKRFIVEYTGRTVLELDNFQDFVIVVLVLCQDMWDNRTMYVDSKHLNKVVESILNLHAVNLL